MVLSLWGEKSGSPMQALHFGYPLGSMVAPLVAYPFVSQPVGNGSEVTTMAFTITDDSLDNTSLVTEDPLLLESRVEIAYVIVGLFGICNGVIFILFQLCYPPEQNITAASKTHKQDTTSWKQVFSPLEWGGGDAVFGGIMVALFMLFYFVNMASIKASGLYYPSYAIEGPLKYTNQEGTLYSSAFNLAGMLGRASAIVAALVLPITVLFPVTVCLQALFSVITVIWGLNDKLSFAVITCLYAYFSFPVWSLGYAWADIYIFLFAIVIGLADMTSKVSDTIFGYLLAYLYEYTVKESIFYNTAVASVALIGVIIVMIIFGKRHGSKYKGIEANESSSVQVLNTIECTKL